MTSENERPAYTPSKGLDVGLAGPLEDAGSAEGEGSGPTAEDAPISDAEFEAMVERSLGKVPPQLMAAVENCAFIVEHDPPPGQGTLLGLYEGVPATERRDYAGAMPDVITIYQNPIVRLFRTRERVEEEVYRTVVHEIGHYFGFEEDELHDLGWG